MFKHSDSLPVLLYGTDRISGAKRNLSPAIPAACSRCKTSVFSSFGYCKYHFAQLCGRLPDERKSNFRFACLPPHLLFLRTAYVVFLFLRRTFVYYHGNRRRNVRQRFGRYFFVPHSGFHFLFDWNCFGNLFPNSFSHPFAARFLPCPCCRAADFLQPRLCQFCGAGSTNLRANVRIRYSV